MLILFLCTAQDEARFEPDVWAGLIVGAKVSVVAADEIVSQLCISLIIPVFLVSIADPDP